MQNKPNFPKSQMNANLYNTRDYERKRNWTLGENKPNSNPIKPNLLKDKTNATLFATKDYRKKDDFAVRKNKANSNPISEKPKMNVNLYVIKKYENETAFIPQKNKPKTNPILSAVGGFKHDDGLSAYYTRDYHLQACGRILVQSGIDSLKYVSRQTAKQ